MDLLLIDPYTYLSTTSTDGYFFKFVLLFSQLVYTSSHCNKLIDINILSFLMNTEFYTTFAYNLFLHLPVSCLQSFPVFPVSFLGKEWLV